MKKICLLIFTILSINHIICQTDYDREWGSMIEPIKLGSNHIANVNPVNGNLYYVSGYDEIFEYTVNNYQTKSIYKFPPSSLGTTIQYITFDSKGNIIITGRGSGAPPPTPGTYN